MNRRLDNRRPGIFLRAAGIYVLRPAAQGLIIVFMFAASAQGSSETNFNKPHMCTKETIYAPDIEHPGCGGGGGGDHTAPVITFTSPALPYITTDPLITISGSANEPLNWMKIEGLPAELLNNERDFEFIDFDLTPYPSRLITWRALDKSGNGTPITNVSILYDPAAPEVRVISPVPGEIITDYVVNVTAEIADPFLDTGTVFVNGVQASPLSGGLWEATVVFTGINGDRDVTVNASDLAGNVGTDTVTFTLETVPPLAADELLDAVEAGAAKYFMENAFPASGFVYDVSNDSTFASLAATGFGLAALPILAERAGTSSEWTYTYEDARSRAELILNNLIAIQSAQSGQEAVYGTAGFFYHFVNGDLERFSNQIEVSITDTALVLAGALTAGAYFGGTVETLAEQLFDNVDWSFFFDANFNQFNTAWTPEFGLNGVTFDRYTDEGVLVSLLALRASPGWEPYEESLFNFPRYEGTYGSHTLVYSYYGSLFTYVFAHGFYDFESLGFDRPTGVISNAEPVDWWQNSIEAAKANRQFCIDRSGQFDSYGPDSWGLSATMRPDGSYFGDNGAMPADAGGSFAIYDGTMPTAMGMAALPFFASTDGGALGNNTAFQVMRHHYDYHYHDLWGPYGFYASFNHLNQFSNVYLGIELGPLVMMIENYRSRLIWDTFMADAETQVPLGELFSFQSTVLPSGNDYSRECEHWTTKSGGGLDFKPHASNGQCLGAGWGRFSTQYAAYAIDLIPSNNLVFKLRYASDFGGAWVDIYIDEELRGSFYAPQTCPEQDACGWDEFAWGDSVQIGGLSSGVHTLKLKTRGSLFGLNIDVFTLRESTETPPVIDELTVPDGTGFTEGDSGSVTVAATDPDDDTIEYQFSVNGELVQSWSTNNTFDFSVYLTTPGIVEVRIQLRDGYGGVSETTVAYAVFRAPVPPPAGA